MGFNIEFMFLESLFNNGLGPKVSQIRVRFILQCLFKCSLYSYEGQIMINGKRCFLGGMIVLFFLVVRLYQNHIVDR
jgi:hypothetical protein